MPSKNTLRGVKFSFDNIKNHVKKIKNGPKIKYLKKILLDQTNYWGSWLQIIVMKVAIQIENAISMIFG